MRKTTLIALAILIISLVASYACTEKKGTTEPQLQLIEHNLSFYNFGDVLKSIVAVEGKAQNISKATIDTASINIRFYDKDGNLLHTASATKNELGAGEIWYFNVRFISPDAWKTTRYDISINTK